MEQPKATHLHVQLLGVPTWRTERGEGSLDGKQALMLAVVATQGEANAAWLSEQVWGAKASGTNLHTNIGRLRKRVGHRALETGARVVLHRQVSVDIHGPPETWPDGDDPSRLEFLHGVVPSPALAPWLARERAHWAQALRAARLLRRAEALMADGSIAAALDAARQAVDGAPELPEAWLAKARGLYLAGDPTGARHALARAAALAPLRPQAQQRADELRRSIEATGAPRPLRLPVSLLRPPRLVGRDAAWVAAERAWEEGRPFVLEGEAGVGKTRLLGDFIEHHGGGLVLQAAYRAERAPYATWGLVLRELQQWSGSDSTPLPPPLAAVALDPGSVQGDARFDEASVLEASRAWLKSLTPAIGAIAIDRLEHADAASLDLLRKLARSSADHGLRWAFATRPMLQGPCRQQLEAWGQAPDGLRRVAVVPWSVEQLAELLGTLDLPRAAAIITPAALHQRTGGVAQLVLFSLQELAFRDTLRPPGRDAERAPHSHPSLRDTRGLSALARQLLELSAVVEVETSAFARALECTDIDVLAARDELALRDLLDPHHNLLDMVRDEVLANLPAAAALRWHAVAAALIAADPRVPRARVAAHWEAAERWPEAALAYHLAGQHAVAVGGAAEALDLYRQAARCAGRCGEADIEFDALHEALLHATALEGHAAGRQILERLQATARDAVRAARFALGQARFEISLYRRGPAAEPALKAANAALAAAQALDEPSLLASAMSAHALAQVQLARHAEAVDEGRRAWALACRVSPPRLAREIGTDLSFIHYEASELGHATALVRELLAQYEAAGDVASVAALESNLANLLARCGDPEAALPPAQRALRRMREVDPSASYSAAHVTRIGISQALGYKGELQAALDILSEQGRPLEATEQIPQVRAMLCAQRAHLHLLLGDAAAALDSLEEDDAGLPVSQRAQSAARRWRALQMQGDRGASQLALLRSLPLNDETVPLPHSPWWAATLLGDPLRAAEGLVALHVRCQETGLAGVARSIAVRRVQLLRQVGARWAEREAAKLATGLLADLRAGAGFQATTYLPEAWLAVSDALRAADRIADALDALTQARAWVRRVAAQHLSSSAVERFMGSNPVNRQVMQAPMH